MKKLYPYEQNWDATSFENEIASLSTTDDNDGQSCYVINGWNTSVRQNQRLCPWDGKIVCSDPRFKWFESKDRSLRNAQKLIVLGMEWFWKNMSWVLWNK